MSEATIPAQGPVDVNVRGFAFWKCSVVMHRNGTEYIIHETPDRCQIEAGNVPAYLYGEKMYAPDNRLWVRPQTEMEDGRFEMVEQGPYADLYAPNAK